MPYALRAQGPVEYLVIAGVVLIVALVVMNLGSFFLGTASDADSFAHQVYWLSARPTGIYDAKTKSSICNTSSRGYTMTLENHESTPIRLTGIAISGQSYPFCRPGQAASSEIRLDTYEKAAIEVPAAIPSSAGKSMSVNIYISYTSTYGVSNVQHGTNPLVITNDLPPCANSGEPCASLSCCSPNTCNASTLCQPPLACANLGESCASLSCCTGHCWSNVCHSCWGTTNGTCPAGQKCFTPIPCDLFGGNNFCRDILHTYVCPN